MDIVYTKIYSKRISKLLTHAEQTKAEEDIAANPLAWPLLKGGSGIRKARARRYNNGKNSGIRIIYYFLTQREEIYMLTAYAKSDQEDLSEADKKILSSIVKSIKEEIND